MSAWELWLWLHEAMQGIPPWATSMRARWGGVRRAIKFNSGVNHYFYAESPEDHPDCFEDGFLAFLRGEPILDARGAPPAAIALLERARAAWNERVYGDGRDADGF